jgi:ABC-type lipoprotein release transport system permease subunit
MAVEPIRGGILPVILEGRGPSGPDEIALGRVVARRLDRGIGSTVEAVGPSGTTAQLTVVGLAVTPDEAGDGAVMSWDGYIALDPDATRNLVFVRYGPGFTDADAAQLADDLYTPPDVATLPTQVQALDRVTSAPFVLAAVLVILALVAIGHGLVTSVRSRRHDLAVLRALGGSRRQLRATVHWQATTLASLALAVAVPVGLIVGGRIFSLLADNVGVVPVPDRSALLVIPLVALVLVLANVAAIVPSRRAGRSSTAVLLREA